MFSVDALISRVEHGQVNLDADTTIYFDEAGMGDTNRLDRLTELLALTPDQVTKIRAALSRHGKRARDVEGSQVEGRQVLDGAAS